MISIVIPARDAAATIGDQLDAIARQAGEAELEVIVADNGSTDDTATVAASFAGRLPVRVVDASTRPGPSAARNLGAAEAHGDLLVFVDADDVVMPGWLRSWAEAPADLAFGTGPVRFFSADAAPGSVHHAGGGRPPIQLGFRPYAFGTNFGIARATFERSGGFPEDWTVAEDVVLSWRLQLAGEELTYLPGAVVAVRRRTTAAATVRQYYRYGLADPRLYREFRGAGVPPQAVGSVARAYTGLVVRLPLLPARDPRTRWCHQAGRRAGRLVGSWRERTWYP